MRKLFLSLSLFLFASSLISAHAFADAVHFAPIAEQSINLGSQISVPLTLDSASGSIRITINSAELSNEISGNDLFAKIEGLNLRIGVPTFASSFTHKKIILEAKDASGNTVGSLDVYLTVKPVFVITVTDAPAPNPHPEYPFVFDSDPALTYFKAQPEGLQLIFKNNASQAIMIHGSGAIEHAPGMTAPGESYLPTLIKPEAGNDLKGYYTFHTIYNPSRNVIFNATEIPLPGVSK